MLFSFACVGSNFLVSASKSRLSSLVLTMAAWMLITPMRLEAAALPLGAMAEPVLTAWAEAAMDKAAPAASERITLRMLAVVMMLLSYSLNSAGRSSSG